MSTSEDLMNKLVLNPLSSVERKLRAPRRRHTSEMVRSLARMTAVAEVQEGLHHVTRHQSLDWNAVPVSITNHGEGEDDNKVISEVDICNILPL